MKHSDFDYVRFIRILFSAIFLLSLFFNPELHRNNPFSTFVLTVALSIIYIVNPKGKQMALGPKKIKDILDTHFRQNIVDEVIQQIDKKLSNPEWLRNSVRAESYNPTYAFAMTGTLFNAEKAFLTKTYLDAGWGEVAVENSEDNGERGGLFSVTLYTTTVKDLQLPDCTA